MRIRPFTFEEAKDASEWRYDGELAMYNGEPGDIDVFLAVDDAGDGYYVIDDDGEMIGFCCFGPEATVPGQAPPGPGTVDVGLSLRPDRLGQRLGSACLPVVLAFASDVFGAHGFRVVVASFNRRSLALFHRAGFVETTTIPGRDGLCFVELVQDGE